MVFFTLKSQSIAYSAAHSWNNGNCYSQAQSVGSGVLRDLWSVDEMHCMHLNDT